MQATCSMDYDLLLLTFFLCAKVVCSPNDPAHKESYDQQCWALRKWTTLNPDDFRAHHFCSRV